jgi:hypothetical protein
LFDQRKEGGRLRSVSVTRMAPGEHSVTTELGEPIDRAGFQNNDRGKRLADARHGGQQGVLRTRPDAFLQALLQNLDL